jgi:hypothetical protein
MDTMRVYLSCRWQLLTFVCNKIEVFLAEHMQENKTSCIGPTLWAELAAQALKGHRAGPALSTIVPRDGWLGLCFLGLCLVPPIVPALGIL